MPKPIDTAPKDGTAVLTEFGVVLYIEPKNWGSPMRQGWAHCDAGGSLFCCADDGQFYCEPKQWEPIPSWMNT